MRKLLFLSALAAILFFSCKKEHSSSLKTSSAKKYAVNIRVANFTVSHANFALHTKAIHLASSSDTLTNLSSYIDQFYYVVLDGSYNWVKTIAQDSTMACMGMITDSLPAGNYYIAMVAGKQGLEITKPTSIINAFLFGYGAQPWQGYFWSSYPTSPYTGQPWQDTFWDAFPITVGTQNISLTTTLNRMVGKLEVTILDDMPANADSLFISVAGPAPGLLLDGGFFTTVNTVYPIAIPASAKGQPNFTVDRLGYNDDGAVGYADIVTITCKDAGGNVLGTATANSVAIHANQKTILSGNLFNNSSPQSFTAVIDTAWSSGVTQVGFSLKHH